MKIQERSKFFYLDYPLEVNSRTQKPEFDIKDDYAYVKEISIKHPKRVWSVVRSEYGMSVEPGMLYLDVIHYHISTIDNKLPDNVMSNEDGSIDQCYADINVQSATWCLSTPDNLYLLFKTVAEDLIENDRGFLIEACSAAFVKLEGKWPDPIPYLIEKDVGIEYQLLSDEDELFLSWLEAYAVEMNFPECHPVKFILDMQKHDDLFEVQHVVAVATMYIQKWWDLFEEFKKKYKETV